jgi:hypothetical protein
MKPFSIFLSAFCVTLLAAAAIAQTTEPPVTSNASRRQSGTVGPPLDAASMSQPAASPARPAAPTVSPLTPAPAVAPAPVQTPEVDPATAAPPATVAPAESAKPATGSRASRRASGRVTEVDGSSGGLPVRPDRN